MNLQVQCIQVDAGKQFLFTAETQAPNGTGGSLQLTHEKNLSSQPKDLYHPGRHRLFQLHHPALRPSVGGNFRPHFLHDVRGKIRNVWRNVFLPGRIDSRGGFHPHLYHRVVHETV